jgi:NAD(P)H dehydrogenase (quinone)
LKGKRGLVIVTTGASEKSLGPRGISGDINDLLFPVTYGVLWYTGIAPLRPHVMCGSNRVSSEAYARFEAALADRLAGLFTDPLIPYRTQNGGDYDDDLVLKPGLEDNRQSLVGTRLRREV